MADLPKASPPKHKRWSVLGFGLVLCWILVSLLIYKVWIHGADHRDFYPRWAGARLAFKGYSLYSQETTRLIQIELYGHELPPDVDQQAFAYPALIVIELLPFWLLPNLEVSAAAWAGLSLLLICITVTLLHRQASSLGFTIPVWAAVLLPFWHYSAVMLFQAQFTALPLAVLGLGYWAWRKNRDVLAGSLLAWGWIKPELVALPTLWFILSALRERRWRFLASSAAMFCLLLIASFVVAGFWLPDWIKGVGAYTVYAKVTWPVYDIWKVGWLFGIAFSLGILIPVLFSRNNSHLLFTLTIPLGMLLLPQTPYWGLALLILPLALAWQGRLAFLTGGVWLVGWLMLLASGLQGWWQIQNWLLPLLTLWAVAGSGQSKPLLAASTLPDTSSVG